MAKQVIPENDILRAEQLRILRAAGVDQLDERIRHLLATGRLSAGAVLAGYGRLMRDLYPRRAGVVALALLGLALAAGCADEETAAPLDAGTVAVSTTATATGTGTALPSDAGGTPTATATVTETQTGPTSTGTGTSTARFTSTATGIGTTGTGSATGTGTGVSCQPTAAQMGKTVLCQQAEYSMTWTCLCGLPCGAKSCPATNGIAPAPAVAVPTNGAAPYCTCATADTSCYKAGNLNAISACMSPASTGEKTWTCRWADCSGLVSTCSITGQIPIVTCTAAGPTCACGRGV